MASRRGREGSSPVPAPRRKSWIIAIIHEDGKLCCGTGTSTAAAGEKRHCDGPLVGGLAVSRGAVVTTPPFRRRRAGTEAIPTWMRLSDKSAGRQKDYESSQLLRRDHQLESHWGTA